MAANLANDAHSCESNSRRNNRGIEKQERLSLATLTSYIQKLSSTMSSQSKHMRTKVSFKISSWQRQDHEDGVPFRRLRLNSHGTLKKNDRELPSLFRVELRLNPSKSPLTSENRHKRNCYFELEALSRPTRQRRGIWWGANCDLTKRNCQRMRRTSRRPEREIANAWEIWGERPDVQLSNRNRRRHEPNKRRSHRQEGGTCSPFRTAQ